MNYISNCVCEWNWTFIATIQATLESMGTCVLVTSYTIPFSENHPNPMPPCSKISGTPRRMRSCDCRAVKASGEFDPMVQTRPWFPGPDSSNTRLNWNTACTCNSFPIQIQISIELCMQLETWLQTYARGNEVKSQHRPLSFFRVPIDVGWIPQMPLCAIHTS